MDIMESKKGLFYLLADSENQIEKEIVTPSSCLKIRFPIEERTYKFLMQIIEIVEKTPEIDIRDLQIEAKGKELKEIESFLFKLALLRIDIKRRDFIDKFKLISSFRIVGNAIYIILPENFRKYISLLRQVEKENQ
jgi:hypothetical protein